ncbi:unnamed protein product [Parajaminaea phylloscopi]
MSSSPADSEETNIKVAVRIRGRAPGEQATPAPVLSTSGPKCSQVHVRLDPPQLSSSASVSPIPSLVPSAADSSREKTYNFDNVFGPEADQGMVYQSIVTPVLSEVMRGYNCTIFAYGQTGTGKTHTMEGDLASQVGTYSSEAGIIPRTLYRLFHQLELSGNEYSVHASFVELYNEELRDLLSTDSPKPLSAGGLKVYDDKSKGVVIQGLEDTPMRDAAHGLDLLRRGSQKRQIAATKCNESSSRSHSVFTLTLHTKETTAKGEDVLRVGKLNLVDLAGSENIGRSGAENKRAREAGMINQSLLTLGRVINALVEKSSHVPYRESKLTRLLQESLGGRTKTCIIATVSADRSDLEETLSTLDYALRAKSIRNRPEMNSRMTRAGLIMEYVKEIERLKRDILAARSKEGFFVSSQSWKEVQDESEMRKGAADELRRLVEVAESKRESLQEQFEQNMQMLVKRETEAKSIKAECAEKKRELDQVIDQARSLEDALAEEMELREAYRNSERKLNRIASALRVQAVEGQDDIDGLFAKLERKTKVEESNQRVVADFQQSMTAIVGQVNEEVADFHVSQAAFSDKITSEILGFRDHEAAELRSFHQEASHRLADLQSSTAALLNEHESGHLTLQAFTQAVSKSQTELETMLEQHVSGLQNQWANAERRLIESHTGVTALMKRHLASMSEVITSVVQQAHAHVAAERSKIADLSEFTEQASLRETEHLKEQNQHLSSLLAKERSNATTMRDKLTSDVMALIGNYADERDRSLRDAVSSVQKRTIASQKEMAHFVSGHNERTEALTRACSAHEQFLDERASAAEKVRQRGEVTLESSNTAVNQDLVAWNTSLCEHSQLQQQSTMAMARKIADASTKSQALAQASYASQRTELESLTQATEESQLAALRQIESTLAHIESASEDMAATVAQHQQVERTSAEETEALLSRLQNESQAYLEDYFALDVPTGETPQKKEVALTMTQWKLVPGTRQKALEQYRHLIAKKQAGLSGPRVSEAHSVGTLPDDTRETLAEEFYADGHCQVDNGSSDGNELEDVDDYGSASEEDEVENSLQDLAVDSDDTVKVPTQPSVLSAGPPNGHDGSTTNSRAPSVTVRRPQPSKSQRSVSNSSAIRSRAALAEKSIDANVDAMSPAHLASAAVGQKQATAPGLKKPSTRRMTRV